MVSNISQKYSKVLDFFQDRSKFAQGYYQFDKDGNKCKIKHGCSFCVLGAFFFLVEDSGNARACLQRVSEHLYDGKLIQEVNDSLGGYEKVMGALGFAKDLWQDKDPTNNELSMPVKDILNYRALDSKIL